LRSRRGWMRRKRNKRASRKKSPRLQARGLFLARARRPMRVGAVSTRKSLSSLFDRGVNADTERLQTPLVLLALRQASAPELTFDQFVDEHHVVIKSVATAKTTAATAHFRARFTELVARLSRTTARASSALMGVLSRAHRYFKTNDRAAGPLTLPSCTALCSFSTSKPRRLAH
jgi:hypothetical protein